jgi:hypothetical protein
MNFNRGGGVKSPSLYFLEADMEDHWLWPFRGGTRQEMLKGIAIILELALLATGFYVACWLLAPIG